MSKGQIIVIGGGVVGLSVAASLAESGKKVVLLERHDSYGQETSGRNSEVIHASIYYPQDSLKGRLCLEGNEMMYDICRKFHIPFANIGKLIVANTKDEVEKLPALLEKAKNNGAKGVRIVDKDEIKKIEPKVKAEQAIYCPTSGIVDSHQLMLFFETKAMNNGADMVYNHEVAYIDKVGNTYNVGMQLSKDETVEIQADILINCAGLGSDKISQLVGINIDEAGYRLKYSKGMYYRVSRGLEKFPKALIYPVPPEESAVGIHTCPDLVGGMRLGPYDIWVDEIEYSVDESLKEFFFDSVKNFLPFLDINDIYADSAGVHPKIQKQGDGMKDFIIRHEYDRGLENFINLIGIESPGLTSSPAIGEYVNKIVDEL